MIWMLWIYANYRQKMGRKVSNLMRCCAVFVEMTLSEGVFCSSQHVIPVFVPYVVIRL